MTQPNTPNAETPPGADRNRSEDALAALRSPELEILNKQHDFSLRSVPSGGALGKIRGRISRWILGDYLSAEHEYHTHLVRHLNELSARLERSLVRLEDRREGSLHAAERRFGTELEKIRIELHREAGESERTKADAETRLETLESITRGLERVLATLKPAASLAAESGTTGPAEAPAMEVGTDYRYLLLENRFRGSEDEIESRLRPYLKVFSASAAPVLEIGSGRGELQRLFRSVNIPSYGYETDLGMAERCEADGLDVHLGDGIAHLRTLSPKSLGGCIAIQVVEHLPLPVLRELLELLAKKLKPGAPVVLETINSESLLALTSNYFRDPTHVAPLHPDTLRFLVEMAGLKTIEVRRLSPYPAAAQLQEVSTDTFLGPRMRETVETLNRNIRLLNGILFGHQDYCIIAEAPAA